MSNILIIGAGAVGIVYGKYLCEGGNEITFFVREKYLKTLEQGEILYHLNRDKHLKDPIEFNQFNLISTFDEVHKQTWDQVYLCISSTALQAFDLATLQKSLVDEPTIVMLQPSSQDYETLKKYFDVEHIVMGMITLISYQAPLSTEKADLKGIAYYLPPMMATPFSGHPKRRDVIIDHFNACGLSAKSVDSALAESLYPSALLMSFLTALEYSSWSFQKLRSDKNLLKQLKLVADEIFNVIEKEHHLKKPRSLQFLTRPSMIKSLLKVAPRVMPMDIETYFEYHFTKVKDQTQLYMQNYLKSAVQMNLPHNNLKHFCTLNK